MGGSSAVNTTQRTNPSGSELQQTARETAQSMADVTEGYPFTPRLLVFKVAGRVFLIVTEDPDEQIITVKAEPPQVDALVREHPTATPGRYLDKDHWVSLGPGVGISRELIQTVVRDSYYLAVDQLPRKARDRLHPPR